jgi:hypothetical protein
MKASAGSPATVGEEKAWKEQLWGSISELCNWLERNDNRGYDPFDGLNAKLLRPFTFNSKLLRTVLQQGVRRFPLNVRPLVGVGRNHSSKGMGFLARGFLRLNAATGEVSWRNKAESALKWLIDHQCPGYSGACWGNHFDYQSRTFYLPKNVPTVVWTALIGHAFLDGYQQISDPKYLEIAVSACEHIVKDLETHVEDDSACISYVPFMNAPVHNANVLGAGFLARTNVFTNNPQWALIAERAIRYTARHQRSDASWYYGEPANLRWVDNFHTAYVLDSFKRYSDSTGDRSFDACMMRGYDYWKSTFFLGDGTPRYYDYKTPPLDIQCCSQAIDTCVLFQDRDSDSITLANKVASWTIDNMQDRSGYFYYRRYSKRVVNKTATLHWGQATMLCALAGLYESL